MLSIRIARARCVKSQFTFINGILLRALLSSSPFPSCFFISQVARAFQPRAPQLSARASALSLSFQKKMIVRAAAAEVRAGHPAFAHADMLSHMLPALFLFSRSPG